MWFDRLELKEMVWNIITTLPVVISHVVLDLLPVDSESLHESVGVDGIAGHALHEFLLVGHFLCDDAFVFLQIAATA